MSDSVSNLYHYDIQSLAKSLKLTSIDVIKTTNTDIESHWFRAQGPADLYFWKADKRIVKHQISLYDQVVEWNEFDGVKTGYVNDDIDAGKAEVICFDSEINSNVVEQAIAFLKVVKDVDPEIINQLINNYRFYNRWSGLAFWTRLFSWVKSPFRRKK